VKSAILVGSFVMAVAAALVLATTQPNRPVVVLPPMSSAPGDQVVSRSALVDDQGAVVIESTGSGATLIGLRRHGGLAWRRTLPADVAALTCSGCPRFVAGDRNGQLLLVDGTHLTPLGRPSEPIDRTGGLPGFGPNASRPLWSTRPDGKVRLRLLAGDLSDALARPGIQIPLSEAQEADSYVAVSADGRRALAVSGIDALRAGQRRVMQVQDSRVVVAADIPVTLSNLDDPVAPSGCIADDGSSAAALLPDGAHLSLLQMRWGEHAGHALTLPVRVYRNGLAAHCLFTTHGIVVYGQDSTDDTVIDIARITANKLPEISRVSAKNVIGLQGCPDSTVVMRLGSGIVVARAGKSPKRYAGSDGGCTSKGTVWILGKRSVTWVPSPNQGR